eukprot:gene17148-23456_t
MAVNRPPCSVWSTTLRCTLLVTIALSVAVGKQGPVLNLDRGACAWNRTWREIPLPQERLVGSTCDNKLMADTMVSVKTLGHKGLSGAAPFFAMDHVTPFVFCWFLKNSCTKLKTLFTKLTGGKVGTGINAEGIHKRWYYNQIKFFKKADKSELTRMFTSPEVQRVILIRDPIERFFSGYMDKVISGKMPALAKKTTFGANTTDIHSFLERADEWLLHDHLGLQSNFCGLRRYGMHPWNIVRVYDKFRMAKIMRELGDMLGFRDAVYNGWGIHHNKSLFEEFTGHADVNGTEHAHTLMTKSLCARLVHVFFEDYAMFFPFVKPPDCSKFPKDGDVGVETALHVFGRMSETRLKKAEAVQDLGFNRCPPGAGGGAGERASRPCGNFTNHASRKRDVLT